MRYIDLDLVLGHPAAQPLIAAAEQARGAMQGLPDAKARKEYIVAHRALWVAFRLPLQETFGKKCWYTESANPGTDDDIDHFRPKGRISERPRHGGYWWEAFNWRNFRLSCHRANRLRENPETRATHGKGDHFPLLDERDRWRVPEAPCHECPSLLDPTDPEDPPLLTFDQDGRVALSPLYAGNQDAAARLEASRRYLHLDWPTFVSDRRQLYTAIYTRVLDGDRADRAFAKREAGAKDALRSAARDLIRFTKDSAPYSRAAQAYVRRFRDRDWVKRNVLPHIPPVPTP